MDFKEIKIFENKSYEDLIKEIYTRSELKNTEISAVTKQIADMIDSNSAAILLPLLTEYSEAQIKNNDQLTKLAGVIQRFFAKNNNEDNSGFVLTEEEKKQLLEGIDQPEVPSAANIK